MWCGEAFYTECTYINIDVILNHFIISFGKHGNMFCFVLFLGKGW